MMKSGEGLWTCVLFAYPVARSTLAAARQAAAEARRSDNLAVALADRLHLHRTRLVDDSAYQAACKKTPQERTDSTYNYVVSRPARQNPASTSMSTSAPATDSWDLPCDRLHFSDYVILILPILLLRWHLRFCLHHGYAQEPKRCRGSQAASCILRETYGKP